jgi:acetyltransferase
MNHHYLEKVFSPSSVVVIGASDKSKSVGMKVFQNLLRENFHGKIYAVNPKHESVQGQICFSSVKEIKDPIDLAVIAAPAKAVPQIIRECGQQHIHAAIVLSSGFSETGKAGKILETAMLAEAKKHQVHIIGPNCLGVMRPSQNLNATFDNNFALPGSIALVSQSGALSAGILDWSMNKKIGFSTIVSLGNSASIDFGDILDYLALDPKTKSILLYIEGIKNPRHFMSALRSAARLKPVIVIKAGKNSAGSRAALSHTGALIGSDDVFDVVLRRAGAVRVLKIEDLFSASEILSIQKKIKGNRLAIITNGGGAGVMAADRAAELKIELAPLTDEMTNELNKILPSQWSHQNPIDIIGDATPDRYHSTLEICKKNKDIDAILTILVPVAMSNPIKVAKEVINAKNDKVILACWLGEKSVKSSWKLFAKNNVPYFDTPEKAVEAFSYLANYYKNQKLLAQVPATSHTSFKPDIAKARMIIEKFLSNGRSILTEYEAKEILKIFDIPVIETLEADTAEKAIAAAKQIGMPVVMKINSPDITHKSSAGGVILNLKTEEEIASAFNRLIKQIKTAYPNAKIFGVTIERQYPNQFDREIMIGMSQDVVFGPVISFGAGGTLVEIIRDRALALPPLNRFIAEEIIAKTRILKPGGKLTSISEMQLSNIINILLKVSEMICELPAIQEMDINPFILNENGMIAVDARMVIAKSDHAVPYHHLVIHPYPNNLIFTHKLSDNSVITIRPICPEDAELEQAFTQNLSEKSKHLRFMGTFKKLSTDMLIRFTQIDYDREMALVAVDNQQKMIGVARYIINPDLESAEFALVVADQWHGKGVGTLLMTKLSEIAKSNKIKKLIGMVLTENDDMLALVKNLGFEIKREEDPQVLTVVKAL